MFKAARPLACAVIALAVFALGSHVLQAQGATALMFYGGNLPQCWNTVDAEHRWSWTYWKEVLGPLVREIGAISPIAPISRSPRRPRPAPGR